MKFSKLIRGKNCYLKLFDTNNNKLVECVHKIFNDSNITGYLNPEYPLHKNKSAVKKWIKKCCDNPVQQWYVIITNSNYIGYVCFKWRTYFNYACEVSTAILSDFRGLKLGYESSKLLADYLKSLGYFKFAVAYTSKKNKKAANNLRKIGFRKNTRLFYIIEKEFYDTIDVNHHDAQYQLLALKLF